jgi:UDP-N-acetylmuramate: L-alanyl-gamma-D-glutamyl-meso-diaminopimelate ligase
MLPIGGTATAPLACLLQDLGHAVSGVDTDLYPPMSTLLEEYDIPVRLGYDAERVPRDVERVVIGNAVPRSNPEVAEVLRRGQPHLAQAEAVAHYLLGTGRRAMVVAGTHGKTTTTALAAWILEASGCDPSYLVGGLVKWSRRSHRLGSGPWAVLEGDEYNTAFFDRGPKFLHYRPELFVLGPVEFDHADLYRDLEAVVTAFRAGTAQVPNHGAVIVCGWDDTARRIAATANAPVAVAGPHASDDIRLVSVTHDGDRSRLELEIDGRRWTVSTPLVGEHNARNATVALAATLRTGMPVEDALAALESFPGVARRMDVVGSAGDVTVVDDFAHHPTALAATLVAARQRWPDRRLVAAFEPRSLSAARREFQHGYVEALSAAAVVLIARPYHADRVEAERLIDRDAMRSALHARGVETLVPGAGDDPVALLLPHIAAGDVVMACSSGSFDGFHRRLLVGLEERSGT